MQFIADLHLHSKYARAVSKDMVLPTMAQVAKQKGIDLLTVSDWTHPLWFREAKNQLEEAGDGLYRLKSEIRNSKSETNSNCQNANVQKDPLFLFSTEIASIYSQGGRVRRIHNLVFAPNMETAEKIQKELMQRGANLLSDGRPIIGISSRNLLELILEIDEESMLIPCHAWTPHFGVYGSASGFDSIDEAFGDLTSHIYGIETGLSSDPEMNWQVEELQNRSILSFSDAHSPAKMGREATVFTIQNSKIKMQNDNSKFKITYEDITAAIKRDPKGNLKIGYTIEFYPEEGKYHFSGHRNCKVVYGPNEIRQRGNSCPVCKRRLTEGVLYRVQHLGEESLNTVETKVSPYGIKWHVDKNKKHPPYVKLVPLLEIIAESMESTILSQKVKNMYSSMCADIGHEIDMLLKIPLDVIQKKANAKIAEGIEKVRKGDIVIDPGYDGEYGKVKIWNHEDKKERKSQNEQKSEEKPQLNLF